MLPQVWQSYIATATNAAQQMWRQKRISGVDFELYCVYVLPCFWPRSTSPFCVDELYMRCHCVVRVSGDKVLGSARVSPESFSCTQENQRLLWANSWMKWQFAVSWQSKNSKTDTVEVFHEFFITTPFCWYHVRLAPAQSRCTGQRPPTVTFTVYRRSERVKASLNLCSSFNTTTVVRAVALSSIDW